MPTKDPRSYVRQVPLPITPQKGIKILARSERMYSPMEPSRRQIRTANYKRRQLQLSSQGFQSVAHKPYQGIGDPFYLEERKLILHALGQWDEDQDWESSSSSEDEEVNPSPEMLARASRNQVSSAAKFVLKRKRKDLNTLGKEVVQGRTLVRNVRLGHGLFDLIQQQRQARKAAAAEEIRRKTEDARNNWKPPKTDSESESESDQYMEDDDDDGDIMRQSYVNTSLSKPNSAHTRASSRKKSAVQRPYTPHHTNLSEVAEGNMELANCSSDALFRQLCVLHWLLEAMNMDRDHGMSPIMLSWSKCKSEMGGKSSLQRKPERRDRDRSTVMTWEQLISNPPTGKNKRHSSFRPRASQPRRSYLSMRSSVSPSSSSLQLNTTGGAPFLTRDPAPDDISTVTEENEDEEGTYSKSIFKFLDEYYESLRRETASNEDSASGLPPDNLQDRGRREKRPSEVDPKAIRKSRSKTPDLQKKLERAESKLQMSVMFDDSATVDETRASVHNIRPKSSPALLDFKSKLPSNRYTSLTYDLRQQFAEVQEDKALTLHDILAQMEKERLSKCQTKFLAMQTQGSSFHRAVKQMREKSHKMMHVPHDQYRKKSSFHGNWFTDLVDSIPTELKELWYYSAILEKLAKFGLVKTEITMVESSSKQSVLKFLRTLEALRDWEICSPDVSAAVEFCREKIVDMTVEEYEEWFQSQFPRILRPQTAPPVPKEGATRSASLPPQRAPRASTALPHRPSPPS